MLPLAMLRTVGAPTGSALVPCLGARRSEERARIRRMTAQAGALAAACLFIPRRWSNSQQDDECMLRKHGGRALIHFGRRRCHGRLDIQGYEGDAFTPEALRIMEERVKAAFVAPHDNHVRMFLPNGVSSSSGIG